MAETTNQDSDLAAEPDNDNNADDRVDDCVRIV